MGVRLSELLATLANGLVRDLNTPIEHHFLNIAVAQWKGGIEPNAVTNDRHGKSVVLVANANGLTLTSDT